MTVKRITGSSIQAALEKARDALGEDVVLMESTPATANAPAEIAVMVDGSAKSASTTRASRGRVPKPPSDDGPLPVPEIDSSGTGTSASDPDTAGRDTSFGYGGTGNDASSHAGDSPAPRPDDGKKRDGKDFSDVLGHTQGPGRGEIFPASDSQNESTRDGDARARHSPGSSFAKRKQRRERPRTDTEGRWASHPLYDVLLEKGLRPETATQLFDELSDRGIDPDDNPSDDLRWAFAQLLCRRIEVADPDRGPDSLAVVGPGGAGKTSLILKMATHDRLLGRGEPVVLHLQPTSDHGTAYQNPTPLYRKFGVAVQNVRTEEEMAQALRRTTSFDHVLIDTPPLPLPLNENRTVLRRIESLLQPLSPDIHFVLSATHAFENLEATLLPHLPVSLSAVSITHLDEAATWGRVVEWLIALDLPVQFVAEGPQVPDGVRAFSLEWFVEDVMDL